MWHWTFDPCQVYTAMACEVIIEKLNPKIYYNQCSYRGISNVTQEIFTTLKIITQPNMYTTTTIPKLYALNLFCKSISRCCYGEVENGSQENFVSPSARAIRCSFTLYLWLHHWVTLSSIHLIILTAVIIASWGQTRKGLMPELDPTCVDWTIYDVNLRHLTLPYPVSKFINICMVACTKKLFFMI